MRRAGIALPVLLALCLGWPLRAAAQTAQDEADLRVATRQLAGTISDPFEQVYLPTPPLHVDWPAKADRPARAGALVLFRLEGRAGGNSYFFYIAHFERRNFEDIGRDMQRREWHRYFLTDFIQVGEKFRQLPVWDGTQATAEGVVIPMQVWQPGDAGCCPGGKAAIRIDVDARGRMTATDMVQ